MVSYKDDLYKLLLVQVMNAPTIPVSVEENLGDPIDIRVDIIHLKPVTAVAFPAAAVVRTQAQHGGAIRGILKHLQRVPIKGEISTLRFRMGMVKVENASLRGKIKTMEAIKTITRSQEKRTRIEMERQKERIKPIRVRALVMTIGLDLTKQILNAQTRAQKPENLKNKDLLAKVGAIAYKLELLQELSRVYNTFHVSNLKKCYADEPLAIPLDGHHIDDKLHFVEEPVKIMDLEVKRLKQSHIPIIKVRWDSRRGPEFTWEREDQFRKKYPHFFTKTAQSSSAAS
ncbi:hypothetical protein Tco_0670617 [Tanacetum coccineum]